MNFSQRTQLASVNIGGVRYALFEGITKIENVSCVLHLERPDKHLYSWYMELHNHSDNPSPRIAELLGMDIAVPVYGNVRLNTLRGDDNTLESFFPEEFDLEDEDEIVRKPFGARSSNTTAFPYFDLIDETGTGVVCGIGWSGQWKLVVKRERDNVRLCAGQEDCNFILKPHETVRSVRVLLYFGAGGTNALRHAFVKLHRKYYSPFAALGDKLELPISSHCFDLYYWGNVPQKGELPVFETEAAQQRICEVASKCNYINAHWIDACWFDGAFRTGVGNYTYSAGMPNGMRAVSDNAHRHGMRFILWFEPARAQIGTEIYNRFADDPEKIIRLPEKEDCLVNLGDPEVWDYQFEHISKIIEENGVDIYRQDFNIDPLEYLRSIEGPDRVGAAQIHFTVGMYRLWDALCVRFPGLIIDDCASGGRMIDVETVMRAIILWQSDEGCTPMPAAMQNENLLLSRYLPYHQGSSFDESPYFMRSAMTTGIACAFDFLSGVLPPDVVPKCMEELQKVRKNEILTPRPNSGKFSVENATLALQDVLRLKEYWTGDFTALTGPSVRDDVLVAYTLQMPEADRGVAVVFRRENAPECLTIRLPGIVRERNYRILIVNECLEETSEIVRGETLADGILVNIETAPGSVLIFYGANEKAGTGKQKERKEDIR